MVMLYLNEITFSCNKKNDNLVVNKIGKLYNLIQK